MAGRDIRWRLFIAWNGTNYQDESARLLSVQGDHKLTAPDAAPTAGRGQVDRCVLELQNVDGRYSSLNSAGALFTYLQDGGAYNRPMYLECSIDGGGTYARIFTGVVKLPQESSATSQGIAAVKIDCRSRDELLLNQRASTHISDMATWNKAGYDEGDIIKAWLDQAGFGNYVLDNGLFLILWPWLDDESPLDEVWNLAAAVGGRFYCDPDGVARYENATHWLKAPHIYVQETLTRADFQGLVANYSDADLYNTVTVEASSRFVDAPTQLWEPDEPVVVPPSSSKKIRAKLRSPAYSLDAPVYKASTAGGIDITANVAVSVDSYVQRVDLVVTNTNAAYAAYVQPFYLTGRPLVGGPTQEESRTSLENGYNAAWWTARSSARTKTIRNNPYIQSRAHAGSLALFLLHRCERARVAYKVTGVPGKPGRRCGDRVTITDARLTSTSRDVFITGISWRLNGSGFVQDLECVDAAQLYPYSGSYFVIGTNRVGVGGGADRIFY